MHYQRTIVAERCIELPDGGATQRHPGVSAKAVRRPNRPDVEYRRIPMLAEHRVQHEGARETRCAPHRTTVGHPSVHPSGQCIGASLARSKTRPGIAERKRSVKRQNADRDRDNDRRCDGQGALDHADAAR